MSPVSPNDSKKAELLQERQKKLAKWKQKKVNSQEQAKTNLKTLTNVTSEGQDKLAERRQKLEEWKRKKRGRDEERIIKAPPSTPPFKKQKETITVKVKRKSAIVGSKSNIFDVSDEDESDNHRIKLFIPLSENTSEDQIGTQEVKKEDVTHAPIDEDPFDSFMKSIKLEKKHMSATRKEDFLDEDDHNVEIDDFEMDNTGTNEDTRYTKIAKMKLKKQIQAVNFTKEPLEPFRKNLYTESEELSSMSENEIEELRLSIGNIKIKGNHCPVPITRWSQLGLSTSIMNLLTQELGYESPTAIQAQAIPAIMSGRDVIGISKTGSGKTISYILPLLRQIKAQRSLSHNETGPLGLVLAPTRELALQINEEIEKFTKHDDNVVSICCTGGLELKQQINILKKGLQIIVATPGRFIDILTLNGGKLISTRRITFVVMDEADRLFDLGFEPQITQIMKTIRPDKQCVLFSATFPNKLRSFALRVLRSPLTITINSTSLINENVKQKFEILSSEDTKFAKLIEILDGTINTEEDEEEEEEEEEDDTHDKSKDEKIIIFVSSQQICDMLYKKLESEGYNLCSIHAGKPYQERVQNLERFKATKRSILICTEVLSRGLNVPEVSLVIIYNAVKTFAQYVHTTGRTARGNNSGMAITLLLENELAASYILSKSLRHSELEEHDITQVRKLEDMSNQFNVGMKEGKYKISSGFGGKGLDNLESKRLEEKKEQKRTFEGGRDTTNESFKEANVNNEQNGDKDDTIQIQVPKLQYTIVKNSNPDGSITYSANVNVNDLPQLVRWEATKNNTLMLIKRETGCSITNKGRYYPEGKSPTSSRDEPKLYLLVEAGDEKDIRLSIDLLEQKVKEGVRKVSNNSIKDTRY